MTYFDDQSTNIIHGCCTRPDTIVINQADYENFNERKAYLAAKLLTIFVEHPIIFLGYSIQDENIEQILESIINCLSNKNLERIKNRLIFIEPSGGAGDKVSIYNKAFTGGKSIEMTRISTDDYSLIYKAIASNHRRYPTYIFRKLQEDVYKFVLTNDPSVKMRVIGINDDTTLEQIETVLGVGVFSEFGRKGYSSITAEEIFWDTVFNDKEHDDCLVVEETLPVLLKHHGGSLPIYKYFKNYPKAIPNIITREVKHEFDGLLSRTIRTKMQESPLPYKSLEDIANNCDDFKTLRLIPMLGMDKLNTNSLEVYFKKVFSNNPKILSTQKSNIKTDFRRVVKIYDG